MRLPSSKSQVVSSVHLRPSLIWWCARCLTRPPQEFADSASAVALLQRQQPAASSTQHPAAPGELSTQGADESNRRPSNRPCAHPHAVAIDEPNAFLPSHWPWGTRPRPPTSLRLAAPPTWLSAVHGMLPCGVLREAGGKGAAAPRPSRSRLAAAAAAAAAARSHATRTCVQWVPVPSTGQLCEATEGRCTQCSACPLGSTGRSGAQGPWGG